MKFDKALSIAILVLGTLVLSSCGGDSDEPGEEELFMDKLHHTWMLAGGHVTLDGVDVSYAFPAMTMTFRSDRHYTTDHGVAPIWPAEGTFILKKTGDNLFNIIRDDGVEVTVVALTDESITLSLQYTSKAGRTKEVSGSYRFVMRR